jgi:hypothetical protein
MSNTSQTSVTTQVDCMTRKMACSLGLNHPRHEMSHDSRLAPGDYGPIFFGAQNDIAGPVDQLLARQAYNLELNGDAIQAYREQALGAGENRRMLIFALNKILQPVSHAIATSVPNLVHFHLPNDYIAGSSRQYRRKVVIEVAPFNPPPANNLL